MDFPIEEHDSTSGSEPRAFLKDKVRNEPLEQVRPLLVNNLSMITITANRNPDPPDLNSIHNSLNDLLVLSKFNKHSFYDSKDYPDDDDDDDILNLELTIDEQRDNDDIMVDIQNCSDDNNSIMLDIESINKLKQFDLHLIRCLLHVLSKTSGQCQNLYYNIEASILILGSQTLNQNNNVGYYSLISHLFSSLECASAAMFHYNQHSDIIKDNFESLYSESFDSNLIALGCNKVSLNFIKKNYKAFLHPILPNFEKARSYFIDLACLLIKVFELNCVSYRISLSLLYQLLVDILFDLGSSEGLRPLSYLMAFCHERRVLHIISNTLFEDLLGILTNYATSSDRIMNKSDDIDTSYIEFEESLSICINNTLSEFKSNYERDQDIDWDIESTINNFYINPPISTNLMASTIKAIQTATRFNSLPPQFYFLSLDYHHATLESLAFLGILSFGVWKNFVMLGKSTGLLFSIPLLELEYFSVGGKRGFVEESAESDQPKRFRGIRSNHYIPRNQSIAQSESLLLNNGSIEKLQNLRIEGSSYAPLGKAFVGQLATQVLIFMARMNNLDRFDLDEVVALVELILTSDEVDRGFFDVIKEVLIFSVEHIKRWVEQIQELDQIDRNQIIHFRSVVTLSSLLESCRDKPAEIDDLTFRIFGFLWAPIILNPMLDLEVGLSELQGGAEVLNQARAEVRGLVQAEWCDLPLNTLLSHPIMSDALRGMATVNIIDLTYLKGVSLLVALSPKSPPSLKLQAYQVAAKFASQTPIATDDTLPPLVLSLFTPQENEINLDHAMAISRQFGPLICSLANSCKIFSCPPPLLPSQVVCEVCDHSFIQSLQPSFKFTLDKVAESYSLNKPSKLIPTPQLDFLNEVEWPSYMKLTGLGSSAIRENVMTNIERVFTHMPPIQLDQTFPYLVECCFEMLFDVSFNIQLSISKAIMSLTRYYDQEEVNNTNREKIIDMLSTIEFNNQAGYTEVFLSLLTQLSKDASEEKLAKIFEILLLYPSPGDKIQMSNVQIQLHQIAQLRFIPLEQLFVLLGVFLRDLMISDIKGDQLSSKLLARALGTSYEGVIYPMLKYILPELLMDLDVKTLDHLAQIFDKKNGELPLAKILIDELHHVLAGLFMAPENRMKAGTQHLLEIFSRSGKEAKINLVIKSCGEDLVLTLVAEMGNDNYEIRSRARKALTLVANRLSEKKSSGSDEMKLSNLLMDYFMSIISRFNFYIQPEDQAHCFTFQLKITRALKEILPKVKPKIPEYIPQILAFMRTVLLRPSLREAGLDTWASFFASISESVVDPILNQVLVTLTDLYPSLLTREKESVLAIIQDLFDRNLPSTPHLSLFPHKEKDFHRFNKLIIEEQSKLHLSTRLDQLISYISQDSISVKERALNDLLIVLKANTKSILTFIISDPIKLIVSNLVKALTSLISSHGGSENQKLKLLAARCFGCLGAIDPGRVSENKAQIEKEDSFDPESKKSCMNLASLLMSTKLTKLYSMTENPKNQTFISYSLQELMKFCDFNKINTSRRRTSSSSSSYSHTLWNAYPESVRSILEPFLDSKLKIYRSENGQISSPIYAPNMTFSNWVRKWAMDMINKVNGDHAKSIFTPCYSVVEIDTDVAMFVLPYLIFTIILAGDQNYINNISEEIHSVLSFKVDTSTKDYDDENKKATELTLSLFRYIHQHLMIHQQRFGKAYLAKVKSSAGYDLALARDQKYSRLSGFINSVTSADLANASIRIQSYGNATLFLEQQITNLDNGAGKREKSKIYDQLHYVFSKLDDEDSLNGISSKLESLTLEQQVRDHETNKNWAAAQTCYVALIRIEPMNMSYHEGLTSCLKNMGYFEMARDHIFELQDRMSELETTPRIQQIMEESCWRLSCWENPAEILAESPNNFEGSLSQILLSVQKPQQTITDLIEGTREQLLPELTNSLAVSYSRGYESLINLHMLHEIEDFSALWKQAKENEYLKLINEKNEEWQSRLSATMSSFKIRDKILNLQRVLVTMHSNSSKVKPGTQMRSLTNSVKEACAFNLVQSSKVARKAGYHQMAYNAILQFPPSLNPMFKVEVAKWEWAQSNKSAAISTLTKLLGSSAPDLLATSFKTSKISSFKEDMGFSIARLLLVKYRIETSTIKSEIIINELAKIHQAQPQWEEAYYVAAIFRLTLFEKEVTSNIQEGRRSHILEHLHQAILHTYRCLRFNGKYVYQLLPRILTKWLDYCNLNSSSIADDITKSMKMIAEELPSYQLLAVFSQLLSRICIESPIITPALNTMLRRVMKDFPSQAIWHMAGASNSKEATRQSRCKVLWKSVKGSSGSALSIMLADMEKLTKILLQLAKHQAPRDVPYLNLNLILPDYDPNIALSVIIPTQASLSFILPSIPRLENETEHTTFLVKPATVVKILPKLRVMTSMMRPIRFDALGSDGKTYTFLCKNQDDLRKDARLMEFCMIFNHMLRKHPEASRRQILIRTFAAVPLDDSYGLIEWVKDTQTVRLCIEERLDARAIKNDFKKMNSLLDEDTYQTREQRIRQFEDVVLPMFPPVLHEWMFLKFPDPTSWFAARKRFSHTLAAMSMVGYVVGLGDRHGENLLIDCRSGDIVHVDFSCLFEKGRELKKAERVPFRLTKDMKAALGVGGVEGTFSSVCRIVLQLLRDNRETLVSHLEAFLHDPLVDFARGPRDRMDSQIPDSYVKEKQKYFAEIRTNLPHPYLPANAASNNPNSCWALKHVRNKLSGLNLGNQTLSVEGQVSHLIGDATDPERLFLMYCGWGAYL